MYNSKNNIIIPSKYMKKKLAIVGLGRIGRSIVRSSLQDFDVKLISDKNPNVENHAYLLNYDSTYGTSDVEFKASNDRIHVNDIEILFQKSESLLDLDLEDIDVLIDATGYGKNEEVAKKISEKFNLKIIITKSSNYAEKEVVYGLNHSEITDKDAIISGSICDANALAHILNLVESNYGIQNGHFISLHPWLSYQNLVDSSVYSTDNPSIPWSEFSLGRSAVDSLIPKNTTAVKACEKVLPHLKDKISSFSFRTPLNTVTSGNVQLVLEKSAPYKEIFELFEDVFSNAEIFNFEKKDLVSIDYKATPYSLSIYAKSIKLVGNLLSLSFWYDNEFAYSQRILDIAKHLK